jgi:hypothetical protein
MTNSPRLHHRFASKQLPFELWRLSDEEYRQLRSRSLPIKFDSFLLLHLALSQRGNPNKLTLPKALLVLEKNFGQSSNYIDTWKQSFSFPFLLTIEKSNDVFHHLLRIEDYRGGIQFELYRIVDDLKHVGKNINICHQPIEDEFSLPDIEYVFSYLWGYLEGLASHLHLLQPEIQPFFRKIDSNNVVYGYWDGQFVEKSFENRKKYERLVQELQAKYSKPKTSEADQVKNIQNIIQSIRSSDQQ